MCELRKEIMKECELELGVKSSEEKRGRGRPRKERKESSEEKRGRGRPRKERKESGGREDLIASLIGMENGENDEENDEKETEVIKFTIKGKIYLKSEENILYDLESHDAVGIWDECEKEIKEIVDEEE